MLSIGFVGMAIGAALGGFVADRVGRKTVFSATLVIFGLANGGMALSWSLAALLIARLIIGLGLGAELPVASTLVSEFSPTKQRGRMTVLLESFWAVGWIVAACIGYFVISEYRRLGLALGFAHWRVAAAVCHCDACSYFRNPCDSWNPRGVRDEARTGPYAISNRQVASNQCFPEGKPLPKINTRELFGKSASRAPQPFGPRGSS